MSTQPRALSISGGGLPPQVPEDNLLPEGSTALVDRGLKGATSAGSPSGGAVLRLLWLEFLEDPPQEPKGCGACQGEDGDELEAHANPIQRPVTTVAQARPQPRAKP